MKRIGYSLLTLPCLLPALAHAHIVTGTATDFTGGLLHPLSGLDHLCAMVAVGLWAAQSGGRALWVIPLSFVTVMVLGAIAGAAGIALPFAEQGIVASVLVLGVLIAAAVRLPLAAGALLVGVFALFHGHAHGMEIPATASGLGYGLGFVAATVMLHGAGIALGSLLAKRPDSRIVRYAGAAIAATGGYLLLA